MCCACIQKKLLETSGNSASVHFPIEDDITLFEIRFGQSIIGFILMCIIVLACRNLAHRIGLSIVVVVLIGMAVSCSAVKLLF